MSRYKPKEAPAVPVVGGAVTDSESGSSREEKMRQWEEQQKKKQAEQEAAAASTAATPDAEPAASVPAQAAEVTLATEPASMASAHPPASGYLPMPEFTEPDSEDPQERLEFYSRGVLAVQYAARSNHERAEQQRLIGLGLRLRAMNKEELHLEAGFDTFGELTEARFGIKKHQANNIIRVLGVAQALEDITTQELKERPLRVLVPILNTHGADAVRNTWLEASRHGNVTDTALKDAANFLGVGAPVDATPATEKRAPAKAVAKPSESLRAVERIRSLAAQDPAKARREAEQLESAVRELLEELSGSVQ